MCLWFVQRLNRERRIAARQTDLWRRQGRDEHQESNSESRVSPKRKRDARSGKGSTLPNQLAECAGMPAWSRYSGNVLICNSRTRLPPDGKRQVVVKARQRGKLKLSEEKGTGKHLPDETGVNASSESTPAPGF